MALSAVLLVDQSSDSRTQTIPEQRFLIAMNRHVSLRDDSTHDDTPTLRSTSKVGPSTNTLPAPVDTSEVQSLPYSLDTNLDD